MHPDMSFLSCAVHELENPLVMPEEFILHTPLFPKKHPVGWREKLSTALLGFPLQSYGVNNGLLMQHIAGMRYIVQQICKGFPSLSLVQSRWIELGYSEDLFEKFIVASLHLKLMEVCSNRLGYRIKSL